MGIAHFLNRLRRQPFAEKLWSDHTLHLLVSNEIGTEFACEYDVRVNDMEHIERFEQNDPWLTREDFVAQCRARIEAPGRFVFTVADKTGPLLGYTMAQANARDSYFPYVDQRVIWPERTGTTYGAFVHPAHRGKRLSRAMGAARNHLFFEQLGMLWIGSAIHSDNEASLRGSARGSQRIVADLRTRRRFGIVSKSVNRRDEAPNFKFEIG